MVQKDSISSKLASIETQLKSLTDAKDDTACEVKEMSIELARVKDKIEHNSSRHDETTYNLKEVVQTVSTTLKDFAADFKIGMRELNETVNRKNDAIDARLLELEKQRWKLTGAIALLSFILSIGILVVIKYLPGYQAPVQYPQPVPIHAPLKP